jgi:hypothetical protein
VDITAFEGSGRFRRGLRLDRRLRALRRGTAPA